MTLTEALLADCETHGAFLWTFKGRWFIALGEVQAVGDSLKDVIEKWCNAVEVHPRYAEKVRQKND